MTEKKVYTEEEKKSILARAEEIGVQAAAKEAGAAWQAVARWKKAATTAVEEVKEEVKAEAKKTRGRAKKAEATVKADAKKAADAVKKTSTRAKKTAKSAAEKVADEVKAVEKKTEEKIKKASKGKKMIATLTIQSPLGGEITPDDIRAKVGDVDHIYVRVDQNKAYWVKGEETGSVDLW